MRRKISRPSLNTSILFLTLAAVFVVEPERRVLTQRAKISGTLIVVTSNADSGAGSLRQAIIDANAAAGLDTIAFSIGVGPTQIDPLTTLPVIAEPVIIDGSTQPGFSGTPLITISGGNVGGNGLHITGGGSTVKSLIVNNFANGLVLENGGGNTVTACNINLNFTNGIFIDASASNTIGGPNAADRNIIVNNNPNGIQLSGVASTNNTVIGNYIGVLPDGITRGLNNESGVFINGAPGNFIGGFGAGERNVISGNGQSTQNLLNAGVRIVGSGASGNQVRGNYIGTNAAGTAAITNRQAGILIDGAGNLTIEGNLISGSNREGIKIVGADAAGITIIGNFIGTNAAGTAALNNGAASIDIQAGVNGTVIGGTVAKERNLINNSIRLGEGSSGTTVQGNYIGTDITGSVAIGAPRAAFGFEALAAILIHNSSNNVIGTGENTIFGGPIAGGGNLISGNAGFGIYIRGTEASGNTVDYNYVGLTASGSAALRNNGDALHIIDGAHHNTIGRIPDPPPDIPGDGTVCIMDDDTGNYIKFVPPAGLSSEGLIDVEIGNGLTGETYSIIGAEYEVLGDHRVGVNYVHRGLSAVVDDQQGTGFAVVTFDEGLDPYTTIFDAEVLNLCIGPTKSHQVWLGGLTFGVLGETNPIHSNFFGNNSVGWNVQKSADLSGNFGSAIRINFGHNLDFRSNSFASGPNAILQGQPSLVLNTGTANHLGRAEYRNRYNSLFPRPKIIALETALANNGLQAPVPSLARTNPDGSVTVSAHSFGPPNSTLVFRIYQNRWQYNMGGLREPEDDIRFTGIEVSVPTDNRGLGEFTQTFTGLAAEMLRFGDSVSLTATVATQTQSFDEQKQSDATQDVGDTSEMSLEIEMPSQLIVGRVVTPTGRGISRAFVKIKDRFAGGEQIYSTNTFGYFVFRDVRPFRVYDLNVTAKYYEFDPVVLLVDDDMRVDVVANQPAP